METKNVEKLKNLQDFNEEERKSYVNKTTNKKSTRHSAKNVNKRVDNVDNLCLDQLFPNVYNVSGPHSY